MDARRGFLKKAILISGPAGLSSTIVSFIQFALANDPCEGCICYYHC